MEAVPPFASGEQAFVDALPLINEAIRVVCRRFRCAADEAEEFRSHSHLKFIEGDYAVFRKYGGRCSLRTYLMVVVQRQFLDHRRQCWGSWRPSAQARRLGPVAVRLDTLLHRDRLGLEEAVERLSRDSQVPERPEALRRLAERLPEHFTRSRVAEEALADVAVPAASVERAALAQDRRMRQRSLRAVLAAAMADLADEDRLILRLRFHDDLTVARIAHMLGLDAKPLYRRIERLMHALRGTLELQGVASADVAESLGEDTWDLSDAAESAP